MYLPQMECLLDTLSEPCGEKRVEERVNSGIEEEKEEADGLENALQAVQASWCWKIEYKIIRSDDSYP